MKATADLETYLLPLEQLKIMVKRMPRQDRILAGICWGIFTMMLLTIILSVRTDNYNNLPIQISVQNEPIVTPDIITIDNKIQQQEQQPPTIVTPDIPSSTIPITADPTSHKNDSVEEYEVSANAIPPATNENVIDNNNDGQQKQQDQDVPIAEDIDTATVPVADDVPVNAVNDVNDDVAAIPVAKDL